MLVEQVGQGPSKGEHLVLVVLVHLDGMLEVEVSLREPRRAASIGRAEGNWPSCRVRRYVRPLAAAKDVGGFDGRSASISHICERAHRTALVGNLEDAERCGHALPRQVVIQITLEGIWTIRREGSVGGLTVGAEVIVRLVGRTRCVGGDGG